MEISGTLMSFLIGPKDHRFGEPQDSPPKLTFQLSLEIDYATAELFAGRNLLMNNARVILGEKNLLKELVQALRVADMAALKLGNPKLYYKILGFREDGDD